MHQPANQSRPAQRKSQMNDMYNTIPIPRHVFPSAKECPDCNGFITVMAEEAPTCERHMPGFHTQARAVSV